MRMNTIASTRRASILVLGDAIAYAFSLILTLAVRYGHIPSRSLLMIHVPAFSILIVIFLVINFSAGLYDKQLALIRGRIHGLLAKVQVVNVLIGIVFFYLAPVAIAPKANLFIFFVLSTAFLYVWRVIMFPVVSMSRKQAAVIVGSGSDIEDLREEINQNVRYGLVFKGHIVPKGSVDETVAAIKAAVEASGAGMIVADLHDRSIEAAMPFLYGLIFSGVQIVDASRLYESVFDRIAISIVGERWLVENSATALGNRRLYDGLKRALDVVIAAIGGTISLVFYPFVYIAIKIEDGGPIFIAQERVGKNGARVKIVKFRSMSGNDHGKYGADGTTKNVVTKVGKFIRVTRIDEIPQFWNVVRGDLSMVGPRPELPHLAGIYEKEIPYYNARHLVKPGLFGWAQIYHENHPHHAVDTEEARNKLYYDLYYIKNRSLALDAKIILRTMQILMKRAGR